MVDIVQMKKDNEKVYPETHQKALIDYETDYVVVPFSSGFTGNSTGDTLKVRRVGKMVQLVGNIKNTVELTPEKGRMEVGTIPEGFRPSFTTTSFEQITAWRHTNAYWLDVHTSGKIEIGRVQNIEGLQKLGVGTYLRISVTYMCD